MLLLVLSGTLAGWRWTGLRGRLMPLVLTVWSSILQFIRQVILLTTVTTASPSAVLYRGGADLFILPSIYHVMIVTRRCVGLEQRED